MSTEIVPPRHPADARNTLAARLQRIREELVLAMKEAEEGAAEKTHFYLTGAAVHLDDALIALVEDNVRIERVMAEVTHD
jgi:hypothetical protein